MLPPPAAPAQDNIGGLFNQVQQLQQEVMRLNGLVEQQAYQIQQLKEQSLERYMEIDRRLASGGTVGAAASGAAVTAGAAGTTAAPPATAIGGRRLQNSPARARPTAPPTRWCAARSSSRQ
jgi:TolA-binding protein